MEEELEVISVDEEVEINEEEIDGVDLDETSN